MQASDALFRLIKSLSKNEKGYFKKYFSGGTKASNYLKLFDAIDRQTEYDEAAILQKFRNEAFAKQLSVTKHYLFEQILKLLRAYHAQSMSNTLINDAIENSEVLFMRGMYPQSFSELETATAHALKYDLPLKQLEVKARERALHLEISAKDWEEQIGRNITDTRKILEDYLLYLELFERYYRLMFFWRHERTIRTDEQRQRFDAMMHEPLLQRPPVSESFYIRQLFATIHMIYNFINNNDEEAFRLMKAVMQIWDDNPHMKQVEPVKYVSAVNNYFNVCAKLNRLDLIRHYVKEFNADFATRNEAVQAILFEMFSTYKLLLLFADNKFDEAETLLAETRQGISQFKERINPVRMLLLKFNSAILYWLQDKLSDAIDMLNEILDEKQVDLRRDVQAASRIIYLILHFELNNRLMLEHAIRSSKRYLQSREKYYETERVFFKHFLQLNHSSDKHDRMQAYKNLHRELTHLIAEQPLEKNFLQTFNIFNWLDAKIEGISMKKLIMRQSQQSEA